MRPRPFAHATAPTLSSGLGLTARTALAAFAAFAATTLASPAWADRVAPLHALGAAADGDRATIDRALRVALADLGHTTPTDAELLQGEGAAGAAIGKSAGLVAVGTITGASWVVQATLTPGTRPRVELAACAVASGRVESVARDLDPKSDLVAPLREMLALLLRPQGVGDDPLPWETGAPPKPGALPAGALPPRATEAASGDDGSSRLAAHTFGLGLGVGAFDLAHRSESARGGRGVGAWSIVGAATVSARGPIVDVVGRAGGLFGPGPVFRGEVGARLLAPVGRAVAIGGAASVGLFAETANAKLVRALLGVDAVVAIAPWSRWQLDLDLLGLRVAPGGDAALVLVGAEATVSLRF